MADLAKKLLTLGLLGLGSVICAQVDPLAALNDEFDDPATLAEWSRVIEAEGWPADQIETIDVHQTTPGALTMIPHTVSWYEDYRGPLVFKEVTGDFVATTSVRATNRAGDAAPGRQYSLAGIMARAPRDITPETWTPGGEKYTFLSIGAASDPGVYQMEVKTTSNEDEYPSYSQLEISNTDCGCGEAILQTARIGGVIIQISKTPTGPWRVINRYRRPDLPETVQVGFVTYTDWNFVNQYPPTVHNETTITEAFNQPGVPTQPDLIGRFDYMRFLTPAVPAFTESLDLANPAQISDEELLSFLGENATSAFAQPTPTHWVVY